MKVTKCDRCGKIYTPDAKKSANAKFRVSTTEPKLHVMDLCYECLDELTAFVKNVNKTNVDLKPATLPYLVNPCDAPRLYDEGTKSMSVDQMLKMIETGDPSVEVPTVIRRGGAEV